MHHSSRVFKGRQNGLPKRMATKVNEDLPPHCLLCLSVHTAVREGPVRNTDRRGQPALASSRMRIRALRSSALAMHRSCLCPVLRFPPPSDSLASKPLCTKHTQNTGISCLLQYPNSAAQSFNLNTFLLHVVLYIHLQSAIQLKAYSLLLRNIALL